MGGGMNRALAVIALAALAGATVARAGQEKYQDRFLSFEPRENASLTHVIWHDTLEDLRANTGKPNANGLTRYLPGGGAVLHLVKPTAENYQQEVETAGHELYHVFFKIWHRKPGQMDKWGMY